MRKILILILIILFVTAFGIMVTSGVVIGPFEVPSIEEIVAANSKLDSKIAELSSSIDSDYKTAQANLDSSLKKEQASKRQYQDTVTYSSEEDVKAASQTEKYEIDFLWTKIGVYATQKGVTIQANVSAGSIDGLYNISFTATGEYIAITEFIEKIENDPKLGFKIEDFGLVPYAEEKLQGTFTIRNVAINQDSLMTVAPVTTTTTQEVANGDNADANDTSSEPTL